MPLKGTIAGIALAVAVFAWTPVASAAPSPADQVCSATADYFLGAEDYREAIATHRRLLLKNPTNALALYHLGFAYGMTGNREGEIAAYRKAAALGLRDWDLYLNFGRALLESGDLTGAAAQLGTAVELAPTRPEPHFNLGLVYERRASFAAALDELELSLKLDPQQPDALNMIGLIYAEQHDYSRAREVWASLAQARPDFVAAQLNLDILARLAQVPSAEGARTTTVAETRAVFASGVR